MSFAEAGIVGLAYFVMAVCTTICTVSMVFSWSTRRENVRLRQRVADLESRFSLLIKWVRDQGMEPPELET